MLQHSIISHSCFSSRLAWSCSHGSLLCLDALMRLRFVVRAADRKEKEEYKNEHREVLWEELSTAFTGFNVLRTQSEEFKGKKSL